MGELADAIKRELDSAGVRHLVSVANGEAGPLYFACRDDSSYTVIDACREGEAVGICAGLRVGGARPVLSIENLGLFECMDSLRALPIDMRIPLPILIGYTGRPGPGAFERAEQRIGNSATQVVLAGEWTERFLDLAGIPTYVLEVERDAAQVPLALTDAERREGPVALLAETM